MRKSWAVLTAAVVVGGCGVGAQDEPHAVTLPRHALTSPGVGQVEPVGDVAQVLCLVRDGRLVQTVRRTQSYPSAQTQLNSLVSGPNAAERATGLTTTLTGLTLTARGISGAEATVEFPDINPRSDEPTIFAQIVCTLTARPDVAEVSFIRDGQRLEVPRADNTLTNAPLRSSDYAEMLQPG
ncbi:GerMN domain-containing protein [Actinoplanes bogorensis]|uniref:GerMN domain-containing protein n=1 Tax=Paractinoplanes bogorensis TaxID=1610840 RepID=A0ABS5YL85_9ACTN|nr:GerMN domain-containing protein [Actinoplanes bogorensis]MBU2664163.1 GerMN domain-containing protein [Actinoplanes bogorensis]